MTATPNHATITSAREVEHGGEKLEKFMEALLQIDAQGFGICGVILVTSATIIAWIASQWMKERKRCEDLTEKALEISENSVTLVERISGRV